MSEQSDLPDWLKALRPPEPAPTEEGEDIPDWLKAMRPRELGGTPPEPEPVEPEPIMPEEPPVEEVEEAPPPPPQSEFDMLREKAVTQAEEFEEEQTQGSAIVQVFRNLKPQQRFILALLIFMNVSTLGCFLLQVLGRISLARFMQ
jgi:hypothetical protein